jgi:hypothetical protein
MIIMLRQNRILTQDEEKKKKLEEDIQWHNRFLIGLGIAFGISLFFLLIGGILSKKLIAELSCVVLIFTIPAVMVSARCKSKKKKELEQLSERMNGRVPVQSTPSLDMYAPCVPYPYNKPIPPPLPTYPEEPAHYPKLTYSSEYSD